MNLETFKRDSGLSPDQPIPYFKVLIVESSDGQLAGYALYFFTYKTSSGKYLYVEDIFVKEEFRKQTAGIMLMRELAKIARQNESRGMKLFVLDWNPARKFYERCGGKWNNSTYNEWLEYEFGPDAIDMLCGN